MHVLSFGSVCPFVKILIRSEGFYVVAALR